MYSVQEKQESIFYKGMMTMSVTSNFFSNKDPNLPNLNLKHLPRIKSALPSLQMQGESDLLFDIDGESVALSEVAEKMSTIFFNS